MDRRIEGRKVSNADVDKWVAEAESGYDVDELRKREVGRPRRGSQPSEVIPVRLTAEELAAVMERAEREHLNRSEAIRIALAEWSKVA